MLQRLDAARLRYAPGTGWRYSNVGYLYVARLIERVTSLELAEALTQRVLTPLGLSQVCLATSPADLQNVGTTAYDPGWVYHGLLVGPLGEAALCLERLLSSHFLPHALLKEMQTVHPLGGPIPGRPWTAPGYGLGLMQGAVQSGLILSGHTGSGPGSVVAVYHSTTNGHTATCAVFCADGDEGTVEARVVDHLSAVLRNRRKD
jgi:CubicO group peptidase (beta-lactamase class C family)